MQRAGLPDLLCIVLGRAVFLEVKLPGGQLTKLQKHTIDELRKHGAISGVVRSVDEALMMVGPLLTVSP